MAQKRWPPQNGSDQLTRGECDKFRRFILVPVTLRFFRWWLLATFFIVNFWLEAGTHTNVYCYAWKRSYWKVIKIFGKTIYKSVSWEITRKNLKSPTFLIFHQKVFISLLMIATRFQKNYEILERRYSQLLACYSVLFTFFIKLSSPTSYSIQTRNPNPHWWITHLIPHRMFFLSRLRTPVLHMYEPINMDALLLNVLASNLLKGSVQVTKIFTK